MYPSYPRGAYPYGRVRRTPRPMVGPATEPQMETIRREAARRELPEGIPFAIDEILRDGLPGEDGKQKASGVIEYLKKLPYKAIEGVATEDGYYLHEGRLFKLQHNRAATSQYAKELVDGQWQYAPGAAHRLLATELITAAEAKAIRARG
jgi:hypothetical protein